MKKTLCVIISIAICSLFVGCVTADMPGGISMRTSEFDGTRELTMKPGWIKTGWSPVIQLGLFWNSKMEDNVVLVAMVPAAKNFTSGRSLHIKIDGEIYNLESIDTQTNIKTDPGYYSEMYVKYAQNYSSKRYIVSKEFIAKMINAKKCLIKLDLMDGYLEGDFSFDQSTYARPSFRKYMEKLSQL